MEAAGFIRRRIGQHGDAGGDWLGRVGVFLSTRLYSWVCSAGGTPLPSVFFRCGTACSLVALGFCIAATFKREKSANAAVALAQLLAPLIFVPSPGSAAAERWGRRRRWAARPVGFRALLSPTSVASAMDVAVQARLERSL